MVYQLLINIVALGVKLMFVFFKSLVVCFIYMTKDAFLNWMNVKAIVL